MTVYYDDVFILLDVSFNIKITPILNDSRIIQLFYFSFAVYFDILFYSAIRC